MNDSITYLILALLCQSAALAFLGAAVPFLWGLDGLLPTLACLLGGALPVGGKRVGIILSGGNVDLDRLPWQ